MAPISPLPLTYPYPTTRTKRGPIHISRFTQLLLFSCLVLFLPTYFYLRPSYSSTHLLGLSSQQDKGKMASQGWGPMSNEDDGGGGGGGAAVPILASPASWEDQVLVDPVKMKSADIWKSTAAGGVAGEETHALKGQTKDVGTVVDAAKVDGPAVIPVADGRQAFAQKMGNATAKAELGRHTWHFLHLLTLRFPDKPTPEQRTTLSTFFHTFSLLYPCGECANHFQELLKEMPVQTSSRMNAALWLCAAHNRVNERLGKEEFPCDKLDESYDCGCGGPDPLSSKTILGGEGNSLATASLIKPAIISGSNPSSHRRRQSLEEEEEQEEEESQEWLKGRTVEECRACRQALP